MLLSVSFYNFLTPLFLIVRSLFYGTMTSTIEYKMQNHYSEEQRVSMSASLNILTNIYSSLLILIMGAISDMLTLQWAMVFCIPFFVLTYLLFLKSFKVLKKVN